MDDNHDLDVEGTLSAVTLHALIGKLAHDLVGPLGTQLGFLDLLAPACKGEEEAKYLERVARQSKKLLDLVGTWRDGIGDASEVHRRPVIGEAVSRWLDCDVQVGVTEAVPAPLVQAGRLVLKWWSQSTDGGEPKAVVDSSDEQVSLELTLPGTQEVVVTDSWQPDEEVGSWHLYVARLIIGRAHGRLTCETDAQGCRLLMSVPV